MNIIIVGLIILAIIAVIRAVYIYRWSTPGTEPGYGVYEIIRAVFWLLLAIIILLIGILIKCLLP